MSARAPVSLPTIFLASLKVGLTAYGMAILQKLRALPIERTWLREEEIHWLSAGGLAVWAPSLVAGSVG